MAEPSVEERYPGGGALRQQTTKLTTKSLRINSTPRVAEAYMNAANDARIYGAYKSFLLLKS
jgi:hypothetical protein